MRHVGPIAGIATSDRHVATAGYDNQIILWDALSRRPLARSVHDHLANHCAFSPDGNLLVSASSDYSARIWEVPSMRMKALLAGHTDDVDMAEFSPDGHYVATCALDRTTKVFDLSGRCLFTLEGHTGNIISVVWSPDGKELVSSSVDGTVRRWRVGKALASGGPVDAKVLDLGVRTDTVVAGADGAVFAGDDKGRVAVIEQGEPSFIQAHQAGIKKLAYHAKGRWLVSLSYDRSVAIWRYDADGGLRGLARSTYPAAIWARAAAFWNDGRLVTGTFGSTYALFDWRSGSWDLEGVVADASLNAVAVQGDDLFAIGDAGTLFCNGKPTSEMGSLCNFVLPLGDRLLTGGQLGQVFDARTGDTLYQHRSPLNCAVSFERRGLPHAAIGTYTGEILVFAQEGDRLVLVESLTAYENTVKDMVVRAGTLFSVCANTNIAWHDLSTLALVRRVERAHERIANACCLAGKEGFASVGRDRMLRLWEPDGNTCYTTPHPNSVRCMASSDDGRILLSGSYGGTLGAFDLATRTWSWFERVSGSGISAVAFSSGRRAFLATSYDGALHEVPLTRLEAG